MNLIKQGLAVQAATVEAWKEHEAPMTEAEIAELSQESGLSPQEVALLPRETVERPPLIWKEEVNITILAMLSGRAMVGVMRAYGRWQRGYAGTADTPEEPAGYVVSDVTIEFGGVEESIYSTLSPDELDEIALAAGEE